MDPMTIDDLRTTIQNVLPIWLEIEQDDDGEIIIRTGLVEKNGVLVDMDMDEDDEDEDE